MTARARTLALASPAIWEKTMESAALHSTGRQMQMERAFEQVFKNHFKELHSYACAMVRNEAVAEGIVQQVFLKLWERAATLDYQQSLAPYLYRSVHNQALNHLKHQKVKQAYQTYAEKQHQADDGHAARRVQMKELQQKLNDALQLLPDQCLTIFQMSRFRDMKYQEIADELGISIKTVEAQMSKALKILRQQLKDYLPILLLTILYT
jgi:RNA polymerase sigma-70 factor, ECF subfamily